MSSERVTVTIPSEVLAEARSAVRAGTASSMSAFVTDAVRARVAKDRALAALAKLYGGPPPAEELAVARRALGLPIEPPLA